MTRYLDTSDKAASGSARVVEDIPTRFCYHRRANLFGYTRRLPEGSLANADLLTVMYSHGHC